MSSAAPSTSRVALQTIAGLAPPEMRVFRAVKVPAPTRVCANKARNDTISRRGRRLDAPRYATPAKNNGISFLARYLPLSPFFRFWERGSECFLPWGKKQRGREDFCKSPLSLFSLFPHFTKWRLILREVVFSNSVSRSSSPLIFLNEGSFLFSSVSFAQIA